MKIVIVDGPLKGRQFPLEKSVITIGRKQDADITVTGDGLVSRYHCQVEQREDGWYLLDLGSGNGTYVGGELVETPRPLPPGRLARAGGTHFVLADDSETTDETSLALQAQAGAEPARPAGLGSSRWQPALDETTEVILEEDPPGEMTVSFTRDPSLTPSLPERVDEETIRSLHAHLRAVRRVSQAIAGKPEPLEMFAAVIDSLMEVVPAQRAFLLEVSEDRKTLRGVVARTRSGKDVKELTISRTIVKESLRKQMAVLIKDAQSDQQLAEADSILMSATRSAMCVPLIDAGKVVALIYLDTKAALAFGEDDLELVTAIGNQTALAMANARLYQQLRQAYEDLEHAHDQMIQTEKLSAIGTLAASIAHDVGNVLTPINGISKILLRREDIDPKLKAAFGRQMQRLKALTQQLLSFSRPKPPELGAVDINAQVEDSLRLVRTEARHESVQLSTELAADLPPVKAESSRLDQVFVNLCINATHAMGEEGGQLVVRTRREGDTVAVEVEDNGCGIPPERLKLVFEPFFTTKGRQGTGLGLFSCKRIIEEEHGGRIEVRSEVGKGTTFTIFLPVVD